MTWLLHLWQSFLALHPWAYVTTAVLALVAFIKRKAIGAALSYLGRAAKKKFFGWFSKNLPLRDNHPHERTYRGQFQGLFQYENPPREWFFRLVDNGTEQTVPTHYSNLLSGVPYGSLVEIDTIRFRATLLERIVRVRVIQR